jgi:hypothetical protein
MWLRSRDAGAGAAAGRPSSAAPKQAAGTVTVGADALQHFNSLRFVTSPASPLFKSCSRAFLGDGKSSFVGGGGESKQAQPKASAGGGKQREVFGLRTIQSIMRLEVSTTAVQFTVCTTEMRAPELSTSLLMLAWTLVCFG